MIGVDTNILVRHFVGDDAGQQQRASAFLRARTADDPAFVSILVIIELVWVLGRLYHLEKRDIAMALNALLTAANVVVERDDLIWEAVEAYQDSGIDFADFLISARNAGFGCASTATFDESAARHIPGMELLS